MVQMKTDNANSLEKFSLDLWNTCKKNFIDLDDAVWTKDKKKSLIRKLLCTACVYIQYAVGGQHSYKMLLLPCNTNFSNLDFQSLSFVASEAGTTTKQEVFSKRDIALEADRET